METILAADIFGKTQALEEMALQLATNTNHTTIVDPYEGEYRKFKNEDEAYGYFQKKTGIERYKNIISEAIASVGSDLRLIGFSVGASAIWAISGKLGNPKNSMAVCFYGSQIRNYVPVNPGLTMELIFPEYEPHFDVARLISQISWKTNVTCHTVPYLHGFMNRMSVNFNESAFKKYMDVLKEKVAYPLT